MKNKISYIIFILFFFSACKAKNNNEPFNESIKTVDSIHLGDELFLGLKIGMNFDMVRSQLGVLHKQAKLDTSISNQYTFAFDNQVFNLKLSVLSNWIECDRARYYNETYNSMENLDLDNVSLDAVQLQEYDKEMVPDEKLYNESERSKVLELYKSKYSFQIAEERLKDYCYKDKMTIENLKKGIKRTILPDSKTVYYFSKNDRIIVTCEYHFVCTDNAQRIHFTDIQIKYMNDERFNEELVYLQSLLPESIEKKKKLENEIKQKELEFQKRKNEERSKQNLNEV
jgi:hypothetical protein